MVICFIILKCSQYSFILCVGDGNGDGLDFDLVVVIDVGSVPTASLGVNTNELRKHGIYNKFVFTVIAEEKDRVQLDNEVWLDKKVCLKKEGHKTYLSFAYARTLYSYQGESLNDLYFPQEEMKYINDRGFYTLISRLKIYS